MTRPGRHWNSKWATQRLRKKISELALLSGRKFILFGPDSGPPKQEESETDPTGKNLRPEPYVLLKQVETGKSLTLLAL